MSFRNNQGQYYGQSIGKVTTGVVALGLNPSLCLRHNTGPRWGDEGQRSWRSLPNTYLDPRLRPRFNSILAADSTHLTPNNEIDSEATWPTGCVIRTATQPRSITTNAQLAFRGPGNSGPNLSSACFGQPPLNGALASAGAAQD